MQKFSLIRRINLGNYQHWEVYVESDLSLEHMFEQMNKALRTLGEPQIDLSKLEKA